MGERIGRQRQQPTETDGRSGLGCKERVELACTTRREAPPLGESCSCSAAPAAARSPARP